MTRWITIPVRIPSPRPSGALVRVLSALLVATAYLVVNPFGAFAANPPTVQVYYVALPDDDLLTIFDANDEQAGTWPDASSPLRSVTSIAIAETGTLVYYDQWEDGGYDGDIANPGGNTYDSGSNPDGTQIWGDGVLSNGCPPSINNAINPCSLASHDQLSAGQVIVLDNDVIIGSDFQVLDNFNTVAYNNNNGTTNWLNDWTEAGDDGAAATGDILITSNQLRFSATETNDSLTRSVDLSGEYKATLTFTLGGTNLETDTSDELVVEYSTDGTTYTNLATFQGASTQTAQTIDLSGISGANTRIRFRSADGLETGPTEFYTIDDVEVTWGFGRSASLVYFDGRDKVGVTAPVAMTRAAFPITPGSVMAGAAEVLDTSQWGTSFVAPIGEDTVDTNTSAFEDVRWFVMAQAGGATIDVDANGDGDLGDANDLNDAVLTQGGRRIIDGIQEGATLTVVSGSAVQVHNMMADTGDTFEFRWDALIPRDQWTGDYYSAVGTEPDGGNGNRGCTEVWMYNPAPSATINNNVRDEFGAVSYSNNNGSANWLTSWVETNDPENYRDEFTAQTYNQSFGTLSWTGNSWTEENDDGSPTGGDVTIRDAENDLEIGDTTAVDVAIFRQMDLSAYSSATFSYTVADSAGASDSVAVEVRNPPASWTTLTTVTSSGTNSHDISSHIANDTQIRFRVSEALEGGDEFRFDNVDITATPTRPSFGDIQIVGNRLRIGEDDNATITRSVNLSGSSTATLTFDFEEQASSGTDDVVTIQVNDFSPDSWVTLGTVDGNDGTGSRNYDLTSYIAATTAIRFVVTGTLEGSEYIFFDNVNIAYSSTSGSITVNIDRPGGSNPDATLVVPPQTADEWPGAATNLYDEGFRLYTTGGEPFLPVQIVDCTKDTSGTDGRLFDWGAPLIPANQLTDEVVVGFAPGCSNESFSGICHDPDSDDGGSAPDFTSETSRSVVWVTALANTTIYVDTNGSGIACPGGAGAEQTQVASALVSYRFDDDPSTRNYVHDLFSSQSYTRNDIVDGWDGTGGRTTPAAIPWTTGWAEGGGETPNSPTAGAIQVNAGAGALRLQELAATSETGRTIQRTHNTSGNSYARLSFILESSPTLDATDRIALDVSGDGGSTWTTLETFVGPYTPNTWPPTTEVYNITPYIANTTAIRFRFVDDMETGDYWQIDDVHIDYVNGGDYDMTASRIKTCNGALISVAYGQDPNLSSTNDEEALDFGTLVPPYREAVVQVGSLGDYVWVDEDGDGDQDAGEVGIPNVRVTLTGTATDGTVYNLVTYTDADGRYIFTGLKPSNVSGYTVTVDSTTLPAGLAANPTYDENGIGTPHTTTVILGAGVEHTTADFGYNWSSPAETNTPGGGSTGAIGDRVWIDTDGDGDQDPDEIGIQGVTVQLVTAGPDGLFGTGDDVVAATTATDHFGNYLFDGLAAGAYEVRIPTPPAGYTQTGDPDGTLDNQTTDPIVLGPGDVFLDADFGYQPTGATGSIGDLVWLDSDRDNTKDAGEPGLPGVTVALIKDLDGDGVWDAGEPIIATDITDENGLYGFTGLPITDGVGTDDYLVWVNDTSNVLHELGPTYDVRDDGTQANPTTGVVTGLEISAVTDLTSTPVTDADFAYAPSGHDANEGLIGDTIFLDRDADGAFDPGEGIEGVTVQLLDDDGLLIATTTTNENGQYFFGGLAAGTYDVQVVVSTLPNAGVGLTNTVDPDGGTANESTVTIGTGGINLLQDFGYRDLSQPNAIGGTLWEDTDTDGTLEGGEPQRFAGVTVTLYEDSNGNGILDGGDALVGTTSTDSNGDYLFSNLPDGSFLVDVTDDANHLNGYWHSLGNQSQAADNESKADPFLVSVSGGQTVTTVDYGYYRDPAVIGNFVWHDLDGDGIQDAGEPGIGGVEVVLTITWPNSAGTTVLRTLTDSTGFYSFGNLLLDEDHNGVGAGEPTFVVSVPTAPTGYTATSANQGANDAVDSDLATGVTATPIEGTTDNTYDFGYVKPGTIGNSVWVDENGDGYQDAGEPGIPNVTVQLWDSTHTTLIASTVTDASGNYLFPGVPPGTYQVDVLDSTLPAGLVQTQIPPGGGDFVNHADPFTTVTVTAGGENLTADFGYNWAPSPDTDGNANTGAIGDRVWVDVDGDGAQDPGEVGINGVTVQLVTAGPDGLFGTGDDVVAATDVTDHNGNYLFDGLAHGAYVVRIPTPPAGYSQTGDPDHFGTTGANDNQTTEPVVLGPGDVFLNADFGYQPTAGTFGSIGDFVWFDRDADGVQDVGETGIPGVTVSLVKDLDGDGVWDSGEPIIATDITDASGLYLFGGLPVTDGAGSDDYLVWVNDTSNVLDAYEPTFDRDGLAAPATGVVSGANIAAVSNLAPAGVTDADFGYTAEGHEPGRGLIGDTIFLDRDADGVPDAGEGIEGVLVQLYDATGTNLLAATTTDENGLYFFPDLDVDVGGTGYRVVVAPGNFASGAVLEGLTNTVDPDGGTANQSDLTLTLVGPINLAQDFGYRPPSNAGSIGNLVWNDVNGDGNVDAGEGGIGGVTVDLYRDLDGDGRLDPGEPLVGTATTAADGSYLFSNLPTTDNGVGASGADYLVDVSDRNGVLAGWWHSLGTSGADNNSQADPYPVSITAASPNNTTADFGYFVDPAGVGNFVWQDLDGDGRQDAGEPGIAGVVVTMVITYPGGATTTLMTTTDGTGRYDFGNLLLDEDYNGDGVGPEPTFALSFASPAGLTATVPNAGAVPDTLDSDWDGTNAVAATPVRGGTDTSLTNTTDGYASYDAGFAVRDLAIETQCFDFVGASPFTIARDTVTHDNTGGNSVLSATGLTLVHTLPSNVTYSSFSASATNGGTTNCTPAGQVVTCTLTGTFTPTDTWTVDFIVTFPGGPLSSVDNSATIDSTETDVDAANDSGICSTSTPVTLASFHAEREGDAVRFTWSTATETGNLGFNLYAVGDGGMERLNDRLIPADHRDAFGPSSYEVVLDGVKGDRFVVEDVDLHAKIRRHGAFDLGTSYGRPIEGEPIDWDAVHAENDALEAERAALAASETAARVAALVANPDAVDEADAEAEGAAIDAANAPRNGARRTRLARLNVDRDGIVRVTYEQLLAAGVDLRGVRAADLALVNRGRPTPVRVTSVGATFGARSTIEFYGEAAEGLYTRVNAYDLVADRRLRQTIGDLKTARRLTGTPATSYQETLTIERDREYSTTAPGADPWYDVSLYAFDRPGSTVVPLPVDDAVAGTAVVTFEIAGESDVPLNPDHHVRLSIDGAVVSDTRFDGVSVHAPRVELPAERLRPDSRLTIELPGDTGAPYDFIGYDKATVIYPRAFVARDGRLSFTAAGRVFRVTGLASADVSVYRFAGSGQAVRYDRVATQRQPDGTYAATFEGTTASARYEVVSGAPPAPAGIAPLPDGADITPSATDYLVIAHPNFIAGIAPLADHHRAAGRRVKVVDVRDVYERHSFGIVDPAAIRAYVAEARARGVRHVLLVGGDTYDYLNHAHPTAMSFIPTLYERTSSVVSHAPVDARLADGDGDGVPDVAIGRLPVKTTAELADLVAKTLGYAAKPYVRTALFASDAPDASISFADLSGQLVGLLPDGWRVARSDIEVDGVATARARLIESVNEGVALTSFVGHSGPTEWTFSGLFSSADARALANAERPTVVVQWGCWNTYHTTPYYHTLSHALLLSGNRGAAATLGASALTLASSEQQLAELVIPRLAAPGATIGEAVLAAKRELARTHPQLADVLLGWNILGDPAIVVEP